VSADDDHAVNLRWIARQGYVGEVHARQLEDAAAEIERLRAALKTAREAIQNYLDGNYDSPRSHRPHHCKHGTFYWEACETCIDEHFEAALAVMETKT
jgi:phage gp36-like protein